MIEIYTDGGCFPNPGVGSWAFVLLQNGQIVNQESGLEIQATNNRMEYLALINGLKATPKGSQVTAYSDSQLLVNTATTWMFNWEKMGWKKKGKGEKAVIKNLDLVKELHQVISERSVKLVWVRGHSGNVMNELCDQLCNKELARHYKRSTEEMEETLTSAYSPGAKKPVIA